MNFKNHLLLLVDNKNLFDKICLIDSLKKATLFNVFDNAPMKST